MKLLIIENDIFTSVFLSILIKKRAQNVYKVRKCESLSEARDILKTFKPEVILLDLSLNDSTSKETIEFIPYLAWQGKVIVISGVDFIEEYDSVKEACLKHGARAFLDKNNLSYNDIVKTLDHVAEL